MRALLSHRPIYSCSLPGRAAPVRHDSCEGHSAPLTMISYLPDLSPISPRSLPDLSPISPRHLEHEAEQVRERDERLARELQDARDDLRGS